MSAQLRDVFEFEARPGEIAIKGKIGYPAIDVGPAYVIDTTIEEPANDNIENPDDRAAQRQLFNDTIKRFDGILEKMKQKAHLVAVEMRDVYAETIDTEQILLNNVIGIDGDIRDRITNEGISAERAIYDYYEADIQRAEKRTTDIKERRAAEGKTLTDKEKINLAKAVEYPKYFRDALITLARGGEPHSLDRIPEKIPTESPIPVSRNFQVADLANFRRADGHGTKIHSLIRSHGTLGDHIGVIARGLRLPVANISDGERARIHDGDMVIVDGANDLIIVNPDEERLAEYTAKMKQEGAENRYYAGLSNKEKWSQTRDEEIIKISANIAYADEMYAVDINNASAIGLYRTELAILARRPNGTSENKMLEIYDQIAKDSIDKNGKAKSITMRTPDFVGDKDFKDPDKDYTPEEEAELEAEKQKYIRDSLWAMHQAAKNNPDATIHVMFPMINTPEEFETMKALAHKVATEVGIPPLKTGCMIETPEAVRNMAEIDADFYSVGTNDLIPLILQYDRFDEKAAEEFDPKDPTNPLVLEALSHIVETAKEKGQEDKLSICGDIASDPRYFALLVGLGYKHLSSGVGNVPYQKELARRIDTREAQALVTQLKEMEDPTNPHGRDMRQKREDLLENFNKKYLGLNWNGKFDDWRPEAEQEADPDFAGTDGST